MIPLVFPAEPPCADQPYLAVSLPDGGSFGGPGLPSLACPETAAPSTCEHTIPMKGAPPKQVSAAADRAITVRYECGPTLDQPKAYWRFDRNDAPSVSYALDAGPPMPLRLTYDELGAARHQLAKARAVLAACDAHRCTPAVEARRKALDAVLARDWTLVSTATFEADAVEPSGERATIGTGLDWATVAYTCYDGETSCTAELLFYDSSIVAYAFDEGDVAHRAWWDGGSVSVTDQLLTLDGDAVRNREP